jgi:molecular chaperone GrpE
MIMTQETVTESPDEQVDAQAPVAENGNTEEAEETTPTLSPEAEQIQKLEAELAAANQKVAELTDIVQRTAAEFQNSRRRQERQLQDEIERASSHLLNRMLPVLDDLSLAFGNLPSELSDTELAWVDGFRQIQKKLTGILEDEGLVAVALDGEFDPNRHEAVTSEPHETVPSGHIIETLRTGYEYKGRILRPALVRVAV